MERCSCALIATHLEQVKFGRSRHFRRWGDHLDNMVRRIIMEPVFGVEQVQTWNTDQYERYKLVILLIVQRLRLLSL